MNRRCANCEEQFYSLENNFPSNYFCENCYNNTCDKFGYPLTMYPIFFTFADFENVYLLNKEGLIDATISFDKNINHEKITHNYKKYKKIRPFVYINDKTDIL